MSELNIEEVKEILEDKDIAIDNFDFVQNECEKNENYRETT